MKCNYICMMGAIPIGVFGCIWKSYIMIICSLMGVLFHGNPDNKLLKYIDVSLNTYVSFKASTYGNNIIFLVIFSGACYILNSTIYDIRNNQKYISGNIVNACNIAHVCLIQMVGLYGYYLLYIHEPCIEFYFICEDNMIINN